MIINTKISVTNILEKIITKNEISARIVPFNLHTTFPELRV